MPMIDSIQFAATGRAASIAFSRVTSQLTAVESIPRQLFT